MATAATEKLSYLNSVWRYDPTIARRIRSDMDAFRSYVEARARHVELSRLPASEYDNAATRAADGMRTKAHNAAIRAAADLNDICAMSGVDPIAPASIPGMELVDRNHRNAVARFVADVLELGPEERLALDLG